MVRSMERVAVVTGAARGIGAAVAAELAGHYGTVVGLEVPGADQSDTRRACEARGAAYLAVSADVSDEASVEAAFSAVDGAGVLHAVVHCAGVASAAPAGGVARMPAAEWSRVLDINLAGTFLVCRAAALRLQALGAGRIITTSSQTARLPSAAAGAHYAASKAGVIAFTRVLALELAGAGVTVNCVAPGLTNTRMAGTFDVQAYAASVPLGRLGEPADVAAAVAFLVSDAAGYITGITLDVNGGKYMG